MFFVYILKSDKNNSYYIGSCKNTEQRLLQHNKGRTVSTKRYAPWQIIYIESFGSINDARKRELQIKSWKSRKAIENLVEKGLNTRD